MKSGIYRIKNLINEKSYIGSATYLNKRLNFHKSSLVKGNHFNILLQRSYNKYGKSSFVYYILEYCEIEKLIEREQFYINKYLSFHRSFGYNIRHIAENNTGITFSEEVRKKVSEANKGRKHSHETKEKIRQANLGKKLSENHKAILAAYNLKRSLTKKPKILKKKLVKKLINKSKKIKGRKKNPFSSDWWRIDDDALNELKIFS